MELKLIEGVCTLTKSNGFEIKLSTKEVHLKILKTSPSQIEIVNFIEEYGFKVDGCDFNIEESIRCPQDEDSENLIVFKCYDLADKSKIPSLKYNLIIGMARFLRLSLIDLVEVADATIGIDNSLIKEAFKKI